MALHCGSQPPPLGLHQLDSLCHVEWDALAELLEALRLLPLAVVDLALDLRQEIPQVAVEHLRQL